MWPWGPIHPLWALVSYSQDGPSRALEPPGGYPGSPVFWELVPPDVLSTEMQHSYSGSNEGGKLVAMVSLFLGTFRRRAVDLSRMWILEPGCLGINPVLLLTRGVAWSRSYRSGFSHLYKRVKNSPSQRACPTSPHPGSPRTCTRKFTTAPSVKAPDWKPRDQSPAGGPHPSGSLGEVDSSPS